MIASKQKALQLLSTLGAPDRLLLHVELVAESAQRVVDVCLGLKIPIDSTLVAIGATLHDVGKVVYLNELNEPGNLHEEEGQRLMLENGASTIQARFCVSHARFFEMDVSLEELAVALGDKLWKGKRVGDLELMFIDRAAQQAKLDRWAIYADLDGCFESIASEGDSRLLKTKNA